MTPLIKFLISGVAVVTCAGGGAGIFFGARNSGQATQNPKVTNKGQKGEISGAPEWILGSNKENGRNLTIVFKSGISTEKFKDVKFGQGFDVNVDGYSLKEKDLLCNLDKEKGNFFVIKHTGEGSNYETLNGKQIKGCTGPVPEGVIKYEITHWRGNKFLSEKQIEIGTCYFSQQEQQDNFQRKIQLICKESSQPLEDGRPRQHILIEVRETKNQLEVLGRKSHY